jgi:hypothetical protein
MGSHRCYDAANPSLVRSAGAAAQLNLVCAERLSPIEAADFQKIAGAQATRST